MNEQENTLLAFFKALSDATRLKLVGLLAQNEASVEELATMLNVSASTVSHHLAILGRSGWYRLAPMGITIFTGWRRMNWKRWPNRCLPGKPFPK